jgi:predicted transcriptional regulator/ribosomal protein S18 acetylase RimI-like enzyme
MSNKDYKYISLDYPLQNKSYCSGPDKNLFGEEELHLKIKEFLLESSSLYSNIGSWWDNIVKPGINSGERVCRLIMANNEIAALSIGKRSDKSAKLCTLKVREKYKRNGLGHKLFLDTLSELFKNNCRNIHYTISEEIQNQMGNFFKPFGFNRISWECNRYSYGSEEQVFSSSSDFLKSRLKEIYNEMWSNLILLSIKPFYAELIEQGYKHVEFRRRFNSEIAFSKAIFYVSAPVKEIKFTANICNIVNSNPASLWKRFGHMGGSDLNSFNEYFSNTNNGYALLLSNVRSLKEAVHLDDVRLKEINFKPPQSYSYLRQESPIFNALPFLNDNNNQLCQPE